jgi:hypothetical protein
MAQNAAQGLDPALTPPVSLIQAVESAQRAGHGQVTGAKLVCSPVPCHYVVSFNEGTASSEVLVDASDGRILPPAAASGRKGSDPPESGTSDEAYGQGHWHAVGGQVSIRPRVFAEFGSGQIAGMGNVVLTPKVSLGLQLDMALKRVPELDTRLRLAAIYGGVDTGAGKLGSALRELRGEATSVYNFYDSDGIAKAGVGLYTEFAHPFHQYIPYLAMPSLAGSYSAEEDDITAHEFLVGADLKFSIQHDRLESSLQNILFLSGNRVAPNLLTYKPLLGFKWSNAFYLLGNRSHPKLSLLADMNFYFARKAGVTVFNTHDGLGGTKREVFFSYGLSYAYDPDTVFTLRTYGYNNLNRGNSSTIPISFRDGFSLELSHDF